MIENPAETIGVNEKSTEETLSHSRPVRVQPPRVWTVFAALGCAVILSTLFQAGLGTVLAIVELLRGADPEELGEAITDRLTSPYVFMLMIALGQVGFALAGFLPAIRSRLPFRERVGWRKEKPIRHGMCTPSRCSARLFRWPLD